MFARLSKWRRMVRETDKLFFFGNPFMTDGIDQIFGFGGTIDYVPCGRTCAHVDETDAF